MWNQLAVESSPKAVSQEVFFQIFSSALAIKEASSVFSSSVLHSFSLYIHTHIVYVRESSNKYHIWSLVWSRFFRLKIKLNEFLFAIHGHCVIAYIYIYIYIEWRKLENGIGRTCLIDLIKIDEKSGKRLLDLLPTCWSHGQEIYGHYTCIYIYILRELKKT